MNKSCQNCKHFHKHYIIRRGSLRFAGNGHCLERRGKGQDVFFKACPKWVDGKEREEENLIAIEKRIAIIGKDLETIKLILQEINAEKSNSTPSD